jgi:hypothetical protein
MRIAFDIGGVLSKYPDIMLPLVRALCLSSEIDVFVISDMKPHEKAVSFCHDNGFHLPADSIVCADYDRHGENCKAIVCEELGIDMLIDDFPGYVAKIGSPRVRLLMMPDPSQPYYSDGWITDGSEGDFGRRKKSL